MTRPYWPRGLSSPHVISPAVAALELQVVEEQPGQPALDGTAAEEAHHLQQQHPGAAPTGTHPPSR